MSADDEKEFWEEEGLAVYAYTASRGDLPIMIIAHEWDVGEHKGVHFKYSYAHNDDFTPGRLQTLSSGLIEPLESDEHFARLIADGSIKRIGDFPNNFKRADVTVREGEVERLEAKS